MTEPAPDLSVVIPVYRAQECIQPLHDRLTRALQDIGRTYEIVYVEDRSPDDSWRTLCEVIGSDPHARAIRMSRNFGQEAATSAGLADARGTWIITMDCDLQDRPEDIARLLEPAFAGAPVVRARRAKEGSLFRRLSTRMYFALLNFMAGSHVDWRYAAFGVMTSSVRDAYLSVPDHNRNLLLVLDWLDFETAEVDVAHDERVAGTSAYTLRKLLKYALAGVLFQTTTPLRWIVYTGIFEALLGVCFAVYIAIRYFTGQITVAGWASLMVTVLICTGGLMVTVGIVGLYVGSVFDQVKLRPRYIEQERFVGGSQ